jgi:hypothetical protein
VTTAACLMKHAGATALVIVDVESSNGERGMTPFWHSALVCAECLSLDLSGGLLRSGCRVGVRR